MSEQVLTMSSQSPSLDSPIPSDMQTFTFPARPPSTSPGKRSTSPEKHQRTLSQDIQLRSPDKPNHEQLKPNPHPYAIKTTSTALLSRSNSSSSKHAHAKHHYIPSTPPSNSKRHRTSSSVSNIEIPRPLPIPPPSPSPSDSEGGNPHTGPPPAHQPRRLKRSETVFGSPSTPPPPINAPLTLEELPPNPKQWTPSQLSVYLGTALRISGGGPGELPAPVANDIAGFVRQRKIGGRVFLRLTEEELEAYGMNKLWRNALLSASRTLRQNVLKGRIWGVPEDDSGNSAPVSPSASPSRSIQQTPDSKGEDETTPNNRKSVFIQRPVYSSAESSSSTEDLSQLNIPLLPTSISDGTGSARFKSISKGSTRSKGARASRFLASSGFFDPPEKDTGLPGESSPGSFGVQFPGGRYKNGRVKGMAKGFERIASVDESASDEPSPSPIEERGDVLSSPTHSKLLSGQHKTRILKDMELLKTNGRVRTERERRTSLSGSEAGSPTKSRMIVDLPCESPTKMFADEEDAAEDEYGDTIVKTNQTGRAMPTWDFEPEYPTMKRHDTGSSTSSSSSSRPLPMPPGPPPVSLPTPNISAKSPIPTISTFSSNAMSPIPTPPPSAGGVGEEVELTVEELLALEGVGNSVRRKAKGKGKGKDTNRVGVHAWENDDDGEGSAGFVTVKRAPLPVPAHLLSPSLVSPLPPSPPVNQTASPLNLARSPASSSPLPQEMAQSKRVITPIASADRLPSRKITPIPARVISPMRVTTELPPSHNGMGMGGIVHPKPVTVVEREITNSAGADTVGRMEEIVRREAETEREREEEEEREVVVRPLPTPPDDGSPVMAPLTAMNLPQPIAQPLAVLAVKKDAETVLIVQDVNTREQQEVEDEQELRALIADVLKTRAQVEVMRKRLGEVEKSVEELKKEVEEAEAKYDFDTIRPARTSSTPLPEVVEDVATPSATEKAKQLLFSTLGFSDGDFTARTSRYTDPKSITDLPPYLALVSLGVCMVVAKVLLKRRGGR
ncbi:hypothetical protein V5O48_010952 [Marasmius crinis-equi]|uniref:SAM domain-containing protein n=1 Tax=Marasmius crinis-equi TaxID=585013 RepID=A0ABR3F7D6_9AGAR